MLELFRLIGGVKGVAIIAAFLALSGWAGWKTYEVYDANKQATEAIEKRDLAIRERDLALEANKQNVETIQQLQIEKGAVQTSLNNLEERWKVDAMTINQLSGIIQQQASNPANHVKLSPVLQAVIDQIQQTRAQREKGMK